MNNKPFELPKFEKNDAGEKPVRSNFGNLLESSKLSRLPSLPQRANLTAATCANCSKRLDVSDEYQVKVKICRTCLKNYANVAHLLEKFTESQIRRHYQEDK